MQIVAKTFFGFEDILAKEVKDLGGKNVKAGNRVVTYEGNRELLYKSNIWLRTAVSVLLPIDSFRFSDEKDLIKKFNQIRFSTYFSVNRTFAVKGAVNSEMFNHSQYPMLLLKDAIADHFRDSFGKRPSVDKERPHVVFDLHIKDNECTVSLNSSGAPLFQRGYRKKVGFAPLNEAIAAGLILRSGWDQKSDLIDPFCGSGTIPIEAALIASGIPALCERKTFSFKYWKDFDETLWNVVQSEIPRLPIKSPDFKIIGSDTDTEMIMMARENAQGLPIRNIISFEAKDFKDQKAVSETGFLLTNPPYGERLEVEEIDVMYKEIGDSFKHGYPGHKCWMISSNLDAFKCVELKPSKKIKVFNGHLECDFRMYDIFKGSLKEKKIRITEPRGRKIKRD
jgi:putative N6-adenine-specific DNA methylase